MSQSNPFEPPSAAIEPVAETAGTDNLRSEPRRVPADNGASWIGAGGRIFKHAWGTWILLLLIAGAILMALSLLPVLNIASGFLFPFFIGGWMIASDRVQRGEMPRIEDLFAGFTGQHLKPMAIASAIYTAANFATLFVGSMLVFLWMGGSMMFGSPPDPDTAFLTITLGVLVIVALMMPVMMLIWFAPALIMLDGVAPVEALKLSFAGCLRNILPMLVYGLISTLLIFIGMLPLLLGWVIVLPIIYCANYASYRDIYLSD